MDSLERFNKLKAWIEKDDIEVEVDSTYYELAKTPALLRINNGQAGSDGYIILYKDTQTEDYNTLTSLLIHEYGHIIEWRDNGRDRHTEKQAWQTGISFVPKKYWPPTLKEDCKLCLSSYGYKNFNWLKTIDL